MKVCVCRVRDSFSIELRPSFSENADDAAGESAEGQTKIPRCAAVADSAEASTSRCERARTTSHERSERRLRQIARSRAEPRDRSQTQQIRDLTDGTKLHSCPMRSSTETRQQEIDLAKPKKKMQVSYASFVLLTLP